MVLARSTTIFLAALVCLSTPSQSFVQQPAKAFRGEATQVRLFNMFNEGKKALVRSIAGEYDEVAIGARLDSLISDNEVLMLSFVTWPFCVKAKVCLDAKKAKYTVVELDQDEDGKAIRAVMGDRLGRTSVPAIWIQSNFVGGCNDGPMGGLLKLDEAGELDALLIAAGAM